MFVMIKPTTFYHKPNESFTGFICFPVFQLCFDPRNVIFVLCEIGETSHNFLNIFSHLFIISVNCSVCVSIMSLPLTLDPRISHHIPENDMLRTLTLSIYITHFNDITTAYDEVLM